MPIMAFMFAPSSRPAARVDELADARISRLEDSRVFGLVSIRPDVLPMRRSASRIDAAVRPRLDLLDRVAADDRAGGVLAVGESGISTACGDCRGGQAGADDHQPGQLPWAPAAGWSVTRSIPVISASSLSSSCISCRQPWEADSGACGWARANPSIRAARSLIRGCASSCTSRAGRARRRCSSSSATGACSGGRPRLRSARESPRRPPEVLRLDRGGGRCSSSPGSRCRSCRRPTSKSSPSSRSSSRRVMRSPPAPPPAGGCPRARHLRRAEQPGTPSSG